MGSIRRVIVLLFIVRQGVIHTLDSTESAKGAALQPLVITRVLQRCTIIDLCLCHRTRNAQISYCAQMTALFFLPGSDRRR